MTHQRAISSITASSSDSILLDSSFKRPDTCLPQDNLSKNDDEAFRFLSFDLKKQRTWREGAIGREITAMALDRSWFFNNLVERHRHGGKWVSAP